MEVLKWHLEIEHFINFKMCDNFQSKSDVGLMYDLYVENDIGLKIK